MVYPRKEPPNWFSNTKQSALKMYLQATLNLLSRLELYIHLRVYIEHIHKTIIMKEEEIESEGLQWKRLEREEEGVEIL